MFSFSKDPGWQGLSPEGSGTSLLSNEELARNEIFYHVKRSGALTYLGKQPDIATREGAVMAFNKISGETRVVNSWLPGMSDAQVLERYRPSLRQALSTEQLQLLNKALMRAGEGTSSTLRTVAKGARRLRGVL